MNNAGSENKLIPRSSVSQGKWRSLAKVESGTDNFIFSIKRARNIAECETVWAVLLDGTTSWRQDNRRHFCWHPST